MTVVGHRQQALHAVAAVMDKIRLLIVDKHPSVRLALAERLSSTPRLHVLATASDLREGLLFARALRPDIVLLELKGTNGKNRLDAIREMISEVAECPPSIIVLTSYADEVEREYALRSGARRYLLKEIDSERLIAEIEAVAAEQKLHEVK